MSEPEEPGYTMDDFVVWYADNGDGEEEQLESFLRWHDTLHANTTLQSFITWYNQQHNLTITGTQPANQEEGNNALIGMLENFLGRDDNPIESYVFAEVAGVLEE